MLLAFLKMLPQEWLYKMQSTHILFPGTNPLDSSARRLQQKAMRLKREKSDRDKSDRGMSDPGKSVLQKEEHKEEDSHKEEDRMSAERQDSEEDMIEDMLMRNYSYHQKQLAASKKVAPEVRRIKENANSNSKGRSSSPSGGPRGGPNGTPSTGPSSGTTLKQPTTMQQSQPNTNSNSDKIIPGAPIPANNVKSNDIDVDKVDICWNDKFNPWTSGNASGNANGSNVKGVVSGALKAVADGDGKNNNMCKNSVDNHHGKDALKLAPHSIKSTVDPEKIQPKISGQQRDSSTIRHELAMKTARPAMKLGVKATVEKFAKFGMLVPVRENYNSDFREDVRMPVSEKASLGEMKKGEGGSGKKELPEKELPEKELGKKELEVNLENKELEVNSSSLVVLQQKEVKVPEKEVKKDTTGVFSKKEPAPKEPVSVEKPNPPNPVNLPNPDSFIVFDAKSESGSSLQGDGEMPAEGSIRPKKNEESKRQRTNRTSTYK
jgi:hypothetical protein